MSDSAIESFLAGHFLFQTFSAEQRQKLLPHCRLISLKNSETLFNQGEESKHFYIVKSGSMQLFRLSPDGQAKVMEVIHAGDPFAEALMFLEKNHYPLNAQAMGDTQVVAIVSQPYKSLLLADPQAAMHLMGGMAVKLHKRISEIEILTLQNTRHRLGNYLFGLAPDPAAQQCLFELPMAKQLIASQLGMQPETFSRLIKEMKDQALIEVNGAEIRVKDLPGLRAFGH
ncbi:Crp/Fnr family transcriptional regulator [Amphritea sp.]|uniref:Crp/Fnr family transcriptional regulator n=1 Tax=Amphritea sp. TaxID=1872502 RepID=UPI003D117AE1